MKRSFLSKLHTYGLYCIIGALLLFPGVLLYQLVVLVPQGYGDALATPLATLHWINTHNLQFIGYRLLLILGFGFMISLPFTLFRIIVAQEILGADEDEDEDDNDDDDEYEDDETDEDEDDDEEMDEQDEQETEEIDQTDKDANGMPAYAWRGRGYAVIAAWGGLLGLVFTVAGTLISTIYLLVVAPSNTLPGNFTAFSGSLAFLTYTLGGGLLALACLFFGVVIARRGHNLWPTVWVLFSYMALALAALLSGSAVEVAYAPDAGNTGQAILTTPAILLFAIWVLWFGIMLVRLQPE